MKHLLIIFLVLMLTACANMTERERQTAWIVGGIVVVGAAISIAADDGGTTVINCRTVIIVRADGSSDHVCR